MTRRLALPYWLAPAVALGVLAIVIVVLAQRQARDGAGPPAPCLHDGDLYSHGAMRRDADGLLRCAAGDWVLDATRR